MYKIIIISLLIIFNSIINIYWYWCAYNESDTIDNMLKECIEPTNLTKIDNMKIEEWFRETISKWVFNISGVFLLWAIWAIAYAWLLMTISSWEDEKIKKWKDILKWSIVGALVVVSSWTIISIIIKVFFANL